MQSINDTTTLQELTGGGVRGFMISCYFPVLEPRVKQFFVPRSRVERRVTELEVSVMF
ncbi:hypothetical protein GGR28_001084 [Lewinella aquimaris]|uniref:Uncharacterized protein n=1 Tax=Neolewinella aquimaris TaxID=1835722 RepID=A0A840DZQ3_9BACT|nr:hypothetical protein [Neolewinella aquimaris]